MRPAYDVLSSGSPPSGVAAGGAQGLVLSHGDFTPSQVLLDGSSSAVVDLDTLCWADPAQDLGRYLAQLHLLAAKYAGPTADDSVAELSAELLRGYGEVSARTSSAAMAT